MKALAADFYDRPVLEVAFDLIGCSVEYRGVAGIIVETEAYHESEPACHAFAGLTPRTRVLFGGPGRAYVYRSYGVHALLNAVCEPEGVGAAVLIRALEPLAGIEEMRSRRRLRSRSPRSRDGESLSAGSMSEHELCSGPGKLTQALGITLEENDTTLVSGPIVIGPRAGAWRSPAIQRATRIGITRAVDLPWRFCVLGNRNVSRPRPHA